MSKEIVVQLKGAALSLNASAKEIAETKFDSINLRVSTIDGRAVQMVDFLLGTKVVASLGLSSLSYAELAEEAIPIGAALGIERDAVKAFALPTGGGTIKSVPKDSAPIVAAMARKTFLTPQQQQFLGALQKGTQKLFQPIISGWKSSEFKAVTA